MSLEARMQRIEDIEAIRDLRRRYHEYINERQFAKMTSIFTSDARIDFGKVGGASGSDEIHEFYAAVGRNLPLIVQFIHNHTVELAGDRATGLAYMDARYAQDGRSMVVAGRFEETYVRSAEGWLIDRMEVSSIFAVPLDEGWAGTDLNQASPMK